MSPARPINPSLPIIVDNKQYNVLLKLIILTKTLQRKTFTQPSGITRQIDFQFWDPNGSVLLPSIYISKENRKTTTYTSWNAIVKKLSSSAGRSTLKVTKKELIALVGQAIRANIEGVNPKGISEIPICLSTDLSEREPLTEIKDPKIRSKAKWTYFKPTLMITPQEYFIKKGGKIGNLPVAPAILDSD